MIPRRLRAVVATALLLAACGGSGPGEGPARDRVGSAGPEEGELVVFAAASLTDVLDDLVASFVERHPDVTVVTNRAGSQTLAGQLIAGARADVLAVADPTAMDRVVAEGLATTSVDVAENRLEIVVEVGNPHRVRGLADLAQPELVVVLAAEQAAAGRYARQVLAAAGVEVSPASLEPDTRAATSRVAMGDADAAIGFRSDVVAAAGRVEGVTIPASQNVVVRYPMTVLSGAANPGAAAAFVDLVGSRAGRAALERAGFEVPR